MKTPYVTLWVHARRWCRMNVDVQNALGCLPKWILGQILVEHRRTRRCVLRQTKLIGDSHTHSAERKEKLLVDEAR